MLNPSIHSPQLEADIQYSVCDMRRRSLSLVSGSDL